MNPLISPYFQFKQRIGIHYFPDSLHYREQDLHDWLPTLRSLHMSWIVLLSPIDRAIPETFIKGLKHNKIEPIIHFTEMPDHPAKISRLEPLIQAYAHWGIKHAIFFSQPNMRSSWTVTEWTQKKLVDQFLDRFLASAKLAVDNEIKPVFPPLYPGGDYWDTIFLHAALKKILEKDERIFDHLQLASYGWTWGRSLNWGAGGPKRWKNNRAYSDPVEPDQRGFRTFEWYNQIAETVLGFQLPVHLLCAGSPCSPEKTNPGVEIQGQKEDVILDIARLAANEQVFEQESETIEPIGQNIASVNFWLLSSQTGSAYNDQSWFDKPDQPKQVAVRFLEWATKSFEKDDKLWRETKRTMNLQRSEPRDDFQTKPQAAKKQPAPKIVENRLHGFNKPVEHYLLLPLYEWGVSDWHLDAIKPFIKKYHATVGFSVKEAALAKKVTVVGNSQAFSDELLDKMRSAGCEVLRIEGDGTSIASQLSR